LGGMGVKWTRTGWAFGVFARRSAMLIRRVASTVLPLRRMHLTRFLFAPPDLRTTDPTIAAEIYAGQFVFAGRIMDARGRSPFDLPSPSASWAETLYGFGWLRHLQAANSSLARDNARALVTDLMERTNALPPAALKASVIARRLMAFLAQSPLVLDGADHVFYKAYLRAVRLDARRLHDARHLSDDPLVRLNAAIALCALGLCVEGAERLEKRFGHELAKELDDQVLADGGHVSRNPRVLIDLLLDVLPLRSTYAARGMQAPRALVSAIDRIVPHLKMLRHPDGSIALFNGMGASQVDALATLFASHDTGGRAATEAPYAGYQRLEAGASVLIMDTGPSPPFAASSEALAGCLSFEFSHGRQRIFVNCGLPHQTGRDLPTELRATAAHTAASYGDLSSCTFLTRLDETRIVSGPERVTAERSVGPDGETLRTSHDGFQALHGVLLRRTVTLDASGDRLSGHDEAEGATGGAQGKRLICRFHLHPSLSAELLPGGEVLLAGARGPSWLFTASEATLGLEESVFFAGMDGTRRTLQIVVMGLEPDSPVSWQLKRHAPLAA
jgi:uncharacterized heparinase superfamily protein